MIPFFLLALLLAVNLQPSEANVGVCYKSGPNQPSPTEVVGLLEKHGIDRIRLFEPNTEILTALKGKNIQVLLGVPNPEIIPLSLDPAISESWVRTNVKPYFSDVKIKYLVVGTDVCPNNNNVGFSFFLSSTIQNLQNALSKEGLKDIKISSSFDTSVLLDKYAYPQDESFLPESLNFLVPILKQLSSSGAPFLVNLYPYYAHILNQKGLSLDSALGKGPNGNVFDLMVDAMYAALEKVGYKTLEIIVAETGWPSAGGLAANVENQKIFVDNLLDHVKNGTPKRPNKPVEIYFYSMFDEDVKGVPVIEKHFGLFTPKKELKFEFTRAFN